MILKLLLLLSLVGQGAMVSTSPPTLSEAVKTQTLPSMVTVLEGPMLLELNNDSFSEDRSSITVEELKVLSLNPDEQMEVAASAERLLGREAKMETVFIEGDEKISSNGSSIQQHSLFTFSLLESVLKGRDNRLDVLKVKTAVTIKGVSSSRVLRQLLSRGFAVPKFPCEDECPCNGNYPYRTADGHCNNLIRSRWGMMSIPFRRWLYPAYLDGVSSPRQLAVSGNKLPSARLVSTSVHLPSDDTDQHEKFTHMLMQWGQFLDHDLTSTPTQQIPRGPYTTSVGCCSRFFPSVDERLLSLRPECFPIEIPTDDRHFNHTCMNFVRSVQVPNAQCTTAPVEQMNQVTAYIDASQVYGSSQKEQNELRTFVDGKLKELDNHLPPDEEVPESCPILQDSSDYCFLAGDHRVNENPTLQSLHTIAMSIHNLIVMELKRLNCHWDDEKLFQEGRKILGAAMQVITYKEYLPIVLGATQMNNFNLNISPGPGYTNAYSESTDAGIRNAFATAAFRMGHSMIRSFLSSFDPDYINLGSDRLSDVFGSTHSILSVINRTVGHYTRGLVKDCVQDVDCKMTTEVTDHLFPDSAGNSFDLASLNIQRGRDHGLPSYTRWRFFCKLPFVNSFSDLTASTHTKENAKKLASVYESVHDVDIFTGGLTETAVSGGLVGPTFACLLGKQFKALKEGDRFWFEEENDFVKFTPGQLAVLRDITLAHVICAATDTTSIPANAFIKHNMVSCSKIAKLSLDPWKEILGEWSPWSVWGPCDDGVQTRTRTCEPCCGCEGPNVETRACSSGPCGWSPWTYWSQCKADHKYRTRECRCPGCNTEVDKCY